VKRGRCPPTTKNAPVGFQALVVARLLVGVELATNKSGAGDIYYFVSRDGDAALDRGDVADVVTRRLPA
jgi:hypothetical protein